MAEHQQEQRHLTKHCEAISCGTTSIDSRVHAALNAMMHGFNDRDQQPLRTKAHDGNDFAQNVSKALNFLHDLGKNGR